MAQFSKGTGDWTKYRELGDVIEVDFHHEGPREVHYRGAMGGVRERALRALQEAYDSARDYVLFTHGWSTSAPGRTTARSVIRGLMRSPEATPYIDGARSIQHHSVFVAAIRRDDSTEARKARARHHLREELERLGREAAQLVEQSPREHYRNLAHEGIRNLIDEGTEDAKRRLENRIANYRDQAERSVGAFEDPT